MTGSVDGSDRPVLCGGYVSAIGRGGDTRINQADRRLVDILHGRAVRMVMPLADIAGQVIAGRYPYGHSMPSGTITVLEAKIPPGHERNYLNGFACSAEATGRRASLSETHGLIRLTQNASVTTRSVFYVLSLRAIL